MDVIRQVDKCLLMLDKVECLFACLLVCLFACLFIYLVTRIDMCKGRDDMFKSNAVALYRPYIFPLAPSEMGGKGWLIIRIMTCWKLLQLFSPYDTMELRY